MENSQAILAKWEEEIKNSSGHLLPQVREARERIKGELSLSVWLGGPGESNHLHYIRDVIRELLRRQNFEVHFSEDYSGGGDIVSKELQEVEALHLSIIIAVSPGSSAEAVEFANDIGIKSKLFVFIPEEYQNGYVFRSLFGRHRLIAEDSLFSLKKLLQNDSDLARKILNRAIDYRFDIYRKKKMKYRLQNSA